MASAYGTNWGEYIFFANKENNEEKQIFSTVKGFKEVIPADEVTPMNSNGRERNHKFP